MPQIPPIGDLYIDSVIRSEGPFNPAIDKTQGVKFRELVKLLRDRYEQEITANAATTQGKLDLKADLVDGIVPASQLPSTSDGLGPYDALRTYSKDEIVYSDEDGYRVLYQSMVNDNLGNSLIQSEDVTLLSSIPSNASINNSQSWFGGWYFDQNNEWTIDHNTDDTWYCYGPWNTRVLVIDGQPLPHDFSQGVSRESLKYTCGYIISGIPAEGYDPANPPTDNDNKLVIRVFDVGGSTLLFECRPIKYFHYIGFRIIIKLDSSIFTLKIPAVSTDYTVVPLNWKKIGYDPVDLSKFIDNSYQPQTKVGQLQIDEEFSNRRIRKLYQSVPYSQRDTTLGYMEECSGQVLGLLNVTDMFVVIGYFYSEGYFQNSFEITIIAYDGAVSKTYNVLQSYGGDGNNYVGSDNATGWMELVPQTDGGSRSGNSIVLEAKFLYPYGWFIRARVRAVDGQPGQSRDFGYYIKSVQGTFNLYNDYQETEGIGTRTGIDNVPSTKSYGPTQVAQRLKLGSPLIAESNYTILARDISTGEVKQIDNDQVTANLLRISTIEIDSASTIVQHDDFVGATSVDMINHSGTVIQKSQIAFDGLTGTINLVVLPGEELTIFYRK